jgi:hypothetical protein
VRISGLKAIKWKCLDCSGGTDAGVRSCTFTACPLFPFKAETRTSSVRLSGKRLMPGASLR